MFKFLINTVKSAIEQEKTQSRINILIGQKKKSDYIKLKLPKKYVPIIEVIAIYGIDDSVQLLKLFEKIKNLPPPPPKGESAQTLNLEL